MLNVKIQVKKTSNNIKDKINFIDIIVKINPNIFVKNEIHK